MYYSDTGNYKNYQEWLDKSPEWEEIKNYFYKNCGPYRCGVCNGHWRLLLHKRSYEYLSLSRLKRRYWYIKPLVVWWLRKHMVWLCFPHNGEIHFKNGEKLPLKYDILVWREREVKRAYKIKKLLELRPSTLVPFLMRTARATNRSLLLLLLLLLYSLIREYETIHKLLLALTH